MRQVLEASGNSTLSLQDEANLLELYLNLESIRLQHPLSFSIELPPEMEPEAVAIPTMMVQPFVENAIWHGVTQLDRPGKIDIKFVLEKGRVTCTIQDNGVGLDQSQAHKPSHHRSMALRIIKERQEILKVVHKVPLEFSIQNLVDTAGNCTGTLVTLSLPIIPHEK